MNGCIYKTKDGECDLYSEGGKYHAWCEMDGCDGRKLSNGDRIRAMSDEELATLLLHRVDRNGDCPVSKATKYCKQHECVKCWLDWLKQEAGECES